MVELRIIIDPKGNGFGAAIVLPGVAIGSAESWPTRAEAVEAAARKLLDMPARLRNLDVDLDDAPPTAPADPIDARRNLAELIAARGVSMAELSRLIGRNAAYIQQFIRRGTPHRLDELDRRRLAAFLGIEERLLGAPAP